MVSGKKTNVTNKSLACAVFQFAVEMNSPSLRLTYNANCALPVIAF